MMSYKISGSVSPEELKSAVAGISSAVENFSTYNMEQTLITIVGAGKYYLRTNDRVGFYLFSASSNHQQRIDFSAVGGGSGLLNISMGSRGRYEKEMAYVLEDLLKSKGIAYELINQ